MARLRLTQPTVPSRSGGSGSHLVVEVSVAAPVPHLDGIYSYRNDGLSLQVGSVVRVPFGGTETHGFVVALRPEHPQDSTLKRISKVLHEEPLFTQVSLDRYRNIAERHGASLFSILTYAVPSWSSRGSSGSPDSEVIDPIPQASMKDRKYLSDIFGDLWEGSREASKNARKHLLLPIGIPWERIAVSLFLAKPVPTLILVPTERTLSTLTEALRARHFHSFIALSSGLKKSERAVLHRKLVSTDQRLLIGTRTAALAPFAPQRVLVVDPGDANYMELRNPYLRADEMELWQHVEEVITLSHSRDLATLASGSHYLEGVNKGRNQFLGTSLEQVISDLKRLIGNDESSLAILVSVTDKNFGNGLICKGCRNRAQCECGFPLRIPGRAATPQCSQCLMKYEAYRCKFCSSSEVVATRAGSQSLALTLAKSIKKSRVHLSNSSEPRTAIEKSKSHDIVISTHGLEPHVIDGSGSIVGYDIIIMLGGRAAFAGSSLARSDRMRRGWGRLLGLANPRRTRFLVDLESHHPEFHELKRSRDSLGLDLVLKERMELHLPPFSLLLELSGASEALHQLRDHLLEDSLFVDSSNEIYPVLHGKMTIKVLADDRTELLNLLQSLTRVRSAKRLPIISYRVIDEDR